MRGMLVAAIARRARLGSAGSGTHPWQLRSHQLSEAGKGNRQSGTPSSQFCCTGGHPENVAGRVSLGVTPKSSVGECLGAAVSRWRNFIEYRLGRTPE